MKTKALLLTGILTLVCASFPPQLRAEEELTKTFQKALFEEEANRDLEAAIKGYEDVVDRFEEQRRLAATAVFRLAECYRKLEVNDKAIAQYERLLEEYSDEETLAKLSRENLVALGKAPPAPAANGAGAYEVLADESTRLKEIERLIANSPDLINAPREDGFTPLERAAREGHLASTRLLLKNGADPNLVRDQQDPPLHEAAGQGHLEVVKLLLESGAEIDLEKGGSTALQKAVLMHRDSVAQALIESGADIEREFQLRQMTRGISHLIYIAENDIYRIEQASVDPKTGSVSYRAKSGQRRSIRGKMLHQAIAAKHWPTVNLLLDKGVDATEPAEHGLTPLHLALEAREVGLVRRLLELGADVEAVTDNGETPMGFACRRRSLELYQLLHEQGADINRPSRDGMTPLLLSLGHLDLSKALITDGAELGAVNDAGQTALSYAVAYGPGGAKIKLVKPLLEAGADPNQRVTGAPPRDQRAPFRDEVTAFMLLFPIRDDDGEAWREDQFEVARLLIEHGADAHARDATGANALFYQMVDGPGLDFLIEQNLDPNVVNEAGQTAFEHATQDNRGPLEKLFRYTHYRHREGRENAIWVSQVASGQLHAGHYSVTPAITAGLPGAESMRLADVLAANFALAQSNTSFPQLNEGRIFRGGALEPSEVVSFFDGPPAGGKNPWDIALEPGDIVELLYSTGITSSQWWAVMREDTRAWLDDSVRKTIQVSAAGEDGAKEYSIIPPRHADFIYDPSSRSLEALTVREFLEKAGRLGPEIDLSKVELVRARANVYVKAEADSPAAPIALDLRDPETDAYLLDGDRIALAELTDPKQLRENRARGIYVARPEDDFIRLVFVRHEGIGNRYSLDELIARIYVTGDFVLPRPDFKRIEIDKAAQPGAAKLTGVDVNQWVGAWKGEPSTAGAPEDGIAWLDWGDIVIIREKKDEDGIPWAGLDYELRKALNDGLSRRVSVTVQGESTISTQHDPVFADFEFADGRWMRQPEGSADWATLNRLLRKGLGDSVSRVFKLTREDPPFEVIFDEKSGLNPNDLWLRQGDHLYFNPALKSGSSVMSKKVTPTPPTRRRLVLPVPAPKPQ